MAGLLIGAPATAEAVPSVTFKCTPLPQDCSGWYRSSVSIDWSVIPPDAKDVGCNDATYVADTPGTNEFCRANDGTEVTVQLKIRIDKTPPVVARGQPVRGPDVGGWYNHPVAVAFSGTDLTSGIASCTSPTFGGPDGASLLVFGTCTDHAGNVSSPFGYGLSYDATAPPLFGLTAATGDRRVVVGWQTTADAESVQVLRTPGLRSEQTSVVFSGPGSKFEDEAVSNRQRYVYEVTVIDAAGNTQDGTIAAVPRPHLISPARLKVLRAGQRPVLRWTPVRRARYYNVQLFRNGRKILSAWPTDARYRLKQRWRYAGQRKRLVPGKYRWLVWPGFGRRSANNYGKRLGPTTFRISR